MRVEWVSTEPNPRTSGMNAAGGWKLHAVNMDEGVAACGMRPAHGWGTDLFITDKCARCKKAVEGSRAVKRAKDFFWQKADQYDRENACAHDVEQEHDPRAPFGFEAVRCKKCGTKFHIPKGEAF